MKTKVSYVCCECGHDETKWLGCCPSCGQWNTFQQFNIAKKSNDGKKNLGTNFVPAQPKLLANIESSPPQRHPTGIAELDRVLGGGLSPGTSVLLGGEPGIGKSTLMLQVASMIPGTGMYITGEESPGQIKNRADRLKLNQGSLEILCETNLEQLMVALAEYNPAYVIIDSIQTLVSHDAGSIPGTPNQLKISGHTLTSWAKTNQVPIFLIAHVTKEGTIAGPKVIEHLVDTVLYFDHNDGDLRILRATKNRLGSVDELGLFRMEPNGLQPISDPAAYFLEQRKSGTPVGSSVCAIYEGSRILLVEIQALVVPAKASGSRVYSDRIEPARVSRVAAVLEKHASLRLSDQDIYVNIAGGLKVSDPGTELALALALCSAYSEKPLPEGLMACGELSLSGEIREIPHLRRRIKTAVDSGMEKWIKGGDKKTDWPGQGYCFERIKDAVAWILTATH